MIQPNPFYDGSRWTVIGSRFETPPFIIEGLRQMLRDCYGDEVADAIEYLIPPPYGTLGTKS